MTIKILGQQALPATSETDVYEVPAGMEAVISSLVIANRGSAASTFRVSISVGGGVTADKDYLYYDIPIQGNDTFIATVGFTLQTGDVLRGYAGNNQLSYSAFGQESAS